MLLRDCLEPWSAPPRDGPVEPAPEGLQGPVTGVAPDVENPIAGATAADVDAGLALPHRAVVSDAEPTPRADEPPPDLAGAVAERLLATWRPLPAISQAAVALALLDLVVRVIGIGGLSLGIDPTVPFSIVTAFLPHYALILLPALILARRPDAAQATPLVLNGALALAAVELLSGPLLTWFAATGPDITGWTVLQLGFSMARAAAYLALGVGLATLDWSIPSPTLAGLSNLVAFLVGGAAITSMALHFFIPPPDLGVPAWTTQVLLVAVLGELPGVAFAFLLRAIVRGTGDSRRPIAATYTASSAAVIAAVNAGFIVALNVIVIVQVAFALSGGALGAAFTLGWFGTGFVLTLLAVAFALGLADTSVRIPRGDRGTPAGPGPGPEPEPVHWPEPGREVPAYRPIERPAEPTADPSAGGRPATTRRRGPRIGKSKQKESRG